MPLLLCHERFNEASLPAARQWLQPSYRKSGQTRLVQFEQIRPTPSWQFCNTAKEYRKGYDKTKREKNYKALRELQEHTLIASHLLSLPTDLAPPHTSRPTDPCRRHARPGQGSTAPASSPCGPYAPLFWRTFSGTGRCCALCSDIQA